MSDEIFDLIQGFVEESQESFETIENDLLSLEDNPDDLEFVNSIFRVLHTIKGTAGFMGLDEVNQLSHKLETIFDMIRKEVMQITPELMDSLLPAIDLLKLMVYELVEPTKSEYDLPDTFALLESLAQGGTPEIKPKASESVPEPEPEAATPEEIEEEEEPNEEITASPELLQDFVVEAEEHLEMIEEALLRLEKDPNDEDSIHEVFRATHSIKGIAGYVGLVKITKLAHRMETTFDGLRKGAIRYSNDMADVVLKGLDLLRTLIFMIKMSEDISAISVKEVVAQLEPFAANKPAPKPEAAPKPQAAQEVKKDAGKYLPFKNLCSQQVITLQALGAELIGGGIGEEELMVLERSIKTLNNGASKFHLAEITEETSDLLKIAGQLLSGEVESASVSELFQEKLGALTLQVEKIMEAGEAEIDAMVSEQTGTPVSAPAQVKADAPAAKPETAAKAHKEEEIKTMRVDANRLDVFMNLIGELIIARNSLNHTLTEVPTHLIPPELLAGLKTVEGSFNRISEDLQTTLMDLRLMPVKTVFQKIPRIVRDIGRKTGKNIHLQMVGENTQIDKSIIEVIGDPLIHIIRNSCDHGIETPEHRANAGKPEQGHIILKASNQGSAITIDIIDDGAGINTEVVLKKAIEKGLVKQELAHTLDVKTINQFIFHPGFSTAQTVSDISGRGVGMDVVISNITKVHGTVDVESEFGHGTQIRLTLPLTLAVIDALLIVEKGQKYAIPLEAVKESIEVKFSELQHLKQKGAINLRGDIVGVAHLADLLELDQEALKPDQVVSIVFIQVGTRVMGLVVDDLSNQQEIVVKPLDSYLKQIHGISGSTILGSGEIILILDPAELVDLAAQ